jgi:hypothetical protein
MTIEYCYSNDGEYFYNDFDQIIIDNLNYELSEGETLIGKTYYRGEAVPITHEECIDVEGFLENCNATAYDDVGECFDYEFTDVSEEAKQELKNLIVTWAQKHVKLNYYKVKNVVELKITEDDL